MLALTCTSADDLSSFSPRACDLTHAVTQSSSNSWTIALSSTLRYSHEASGYIWAEVVLLDRQIVIQGLDEPSPNQNDGV